MTVDAVRRTQGASSPSEAPGVRDTAGAPADLEPTQQGVLRWTFRRRRRWIVGAAVFTSVHQMCEAAVPVLIGATVDHALHGGGPGALALWIGLLGAVFLVLSAAMRLGGRWNRQGSQGAAHDLRMAAATRLLDARGFERTSLSSGALLSTATSDALRVGLGNRFWVLGAGSVAAIAFGAAALLITSVRLGLVVLVGLVPLLVLTQLLSKPLAARGGAEQAQVAEATATAADLVRGLRVLKGLGAEAAARQRYRGASRSALAATVRAARWDAGHQGVSLLLNGLFLVCITWFGARLAMEGRLSVGEFVSSVGLAQFLVGPCNVFAGAVGLRARARGSAKRMAQLLAEPYALTGGAGDGTPETGRGGLTLAGLSHGPLKELDLHVGSGELVGVVAPDPVASAALVDVLALRVPPDGGGILLGGEPLAALSLSAARGAVLVADHDGDLFDGTIEENVAIAAVPERVPAALAAADADQVASVLPGGAGSRIGERGRQLSGGQRQRVALARALAADAPVLVLHEPTTAVDPATEARIARGLRELRRGRTTLLVTTSPILLRHCDRVVLIGDGAVAADGAHADLLRDHSVYRAAVTA
ncbi:ABC transporter transmembrane domain-containing protein [Streptomyces sp. DW26H14]|uniref:ABC transporter transmembrane domain-containing protein n=1 Tax=Streptomyces sp. DW26H14 TaxID=3435395 RepID=UPI00403DF1E6